ncbi:MAG: hypothetical protein M5U09_26480 [Gammaproteobacteria bacterium]|nr:hypothetical protein [Gammaproteobacteria bacterium]
MFQRAREHRYRAAGGDHTAEVEYAVGRRLDAEAHVLEIEALDHHVAAGRQQDGAVVGADESRVGDVGRDQHHVAAVANPDIAAVLDRPAVAGKAHVPGEEVGVRDVQRRGDEAGGIDHRVLPEHDAVGVDQEHLAVRQQAAEYLGRRAADHPVEHRRVGMLLDEPRHFVAADGESAPVDDGAGRVGHVERTARPVGETGLAVHDARPDRVAVGGRRQHGGDRHGQQRAPERYLLSSVLAAGPGTHGVTSRGRVTDCAERHPVFDGVMNAPMDYSTSQAG